MSAILRSAADWPSRAKLSYGAIWPSRILARGFWWQLDAYWAYARERIRRFAQYVPDMEEVPEPLELKALKLELSPTSEPL